MERKAEVNYSDPFELLRNMNDVIMCYEPKKVNSTTLELNDENQASNANLNSSRWSHNNKAGN